MLAINWIVLRWSATTGYYLAALRADQTLVYLTMKGKCVTPVADCGIFRSFESDLARYCRARLVLRLDFIDERRKSLSF